MKKHLFTLGKCLLVSVLFTLFVILLLGLILYRFGLSPRIIEICNTLTYFLAPSVGGFLLGKRNKEKRYLWGILLGLIYFCLLLILSVCMKSLAGFSTDCIRIFLFCLCGGMIGGMLGM